MTKPKRDIIDSLKRLNRDRHWLAKASGYDYNTVNNKLGPSGKISERMINAFERAILEEERRPDPPSRCLAGTTVWDLVMFSGREVTEINEGRRLGGYDNIEDLYHDAVINFCDCLIAQEGDERP